MTGSGTLLARGLVSDMSLEFDLQALQFHVHAEHVIEGKYYDMEMQMIHKIVPAYLPRSSVWTASYLSVSVFFEVQPVANNTFLDSLNIHTLDGIKGMNLAEFFNSLEPNYIYYNGSLSTPSCNENTHRFLMLDVQRMSEAQLNEFRYHYDGNYRDIKVSEMSSMKVRKVTKRMARSLKSYGGNVSEILALAVAVLLVLISVIL
eukprot:TRINITY_DN5670_c0_g1_i2.p1 TRINITY_DN5670_c0_g1~~TRINITY_DN5670_c0_g1_i2.p1  ORF type:complete len:204 (+),score=59.94 TRINITY_DN5670_c0_g1_i2:270-881(+)